MPSVEHPLLGQPIEHCCGSELQRGIAIKAIETRIAETVAATGTHLTDIVGVAAVSAAIILGEVGDVARFATADHFASYTGTAPIEAPSRDIIRRRLSGAGNRG